MTVTQTIINKTIEYLGIPSVIDHENAFIDHLVRDFKALGLSVEQDKRIIVVHGEKPHSHIVSAHIDRHGLISIGGGEYFYAAQYIKEIRYGESNINASQILARAAQNFLGENVFSYNSETGEPIGYGTISKLDPVNIRGDGIFNIHALREMPLGTPIAYSQKPCVTKTHFSGQIDNALSVALIYALFANGYQGTALLTTEEELGKSWLHIARYFEEENIETDSLIVLDTSPYPDEAQQIIDDGTVVLRKQDKSETFNHALAHDISNMCKTLKLPYHFKDEYLLNKGKKQDELGSTELGKLIKFTDKRWNGTTIQIPTTDYHTSAETTSYKAIENTYKLLNKMLIK